MHIVTFSLWDIMIFWCIVASLLILVLKIRPLWGDSVCVCVVSRGCGSFFCFRFSSHWLCLTIEHTWFAKKSWCEPSRASSAVHTSPRLAPSLKEPDGWQPRPDKMDSFFIWDLFSYPINLAHLNLLLRPLVAPQWSVQKQQNTIKTKPTVLSS